MEFSRQAFENTFWNLFQLHREAVGAVTSDPGASGREAFVHFVSSLRDVTPSQSEEPRTDNSSTDNPNQEFRFVIVFTASIC